jgi:hypothetical protein
MKSFILEAHFGRANIKSMVNSDKIDETVAYWAKQLEKLKSREPDGRQASKDLVLQCLKENKHHTDKDAAEMVCAALIWITATGPAGPTVLPYMRRGDMTVSYEITHVKGDTHNFRLKLDEKTSAVIGL